MDSRADIREFLVSRRAKISPTQVGLPAGSRRRVAGLRREEVAVLAGVSTDWYTRLEKGHIAGVSEDVLEAVARALQLDEEERTYLFDLARAARPAHRRASRRREAGIAPSVQWMLDSITMSAAFVRNGRLEVVTSNALARALHEPMFASHTTHEHGRASFPRYHFLDSTSRDFFVDWEEGAATTVSLLRAEAGREPHDRALRELIGELSTLSPEFRTLWASHDVRIRHAGVKRLQHPEVGQLELTYQSVALPISLHSVYDLSLYTAEPGTPHEERLKLLASLSAPAALRSDSSQVARDQ
jgi:transcriptional regulator with XRE-family HTH domain